MTALPFSQALTALAPSVAGDVGVLRREGVPVLALGQSRLPLTDTDTAPHVLSLCHGFQVSGPYARRVAAEVVKGEPFGDRSHEQFVHDAVGSQRRSAPTAKANFAVAVRVTRSRPQPAFVANRELVGHAVEEWLSCGARHAHILAPPKPKQAFKADHDTGLWAPVPGTERMR